MGDSGANLSGPMGVATLYAQWVKPASYKISYVAVKGVKIPAKAVKKYTSGEGAKLPIASYKGTGKFAGWSIAVKGKKEKIMWRLFEQAEVKTH